VTIVSRPAPPGIVASRNPVGRVSWGAPRCGSAGTGVSSVDVLGKLTGILLVAALVAVSATGCGSTADKAGNPEAPVVLRLADPYDSTITDAEALQWIVQRVDLISHGKLRIRVTYNAAGDRIADVEARVARMVEQGRFDLGWIGTRAWDELGVKSFQALQAPFLVTDYALLDRILTGRLAGRMLAGLPGRRWVGLVLVPDLMRHPIGLEQPLVSTADFKGARVRDIPSRATDAVLRALGAVPVHVAGADYNDAVVRHRIDGEELAIVDTPFGSSVTGNVSFFPKVMTLFAGRPAYDRLSDGQKGVLQEAARQLRRHIFAPSETSLIAQICSGKPHGRVVLATEQQLAQLAHATRPVYAQLERDPETRSLIAAVRRLKASLPVPPPIVAPRSCAAEAEPPPPTGAPGPSSVLNGTYRWVLTASAARAFGSPASNPENAHYPSVSQAVLRDGKWIWTTGGPADRGTYTIRGTRITFASAGYGSSLDFTFTRDGDGTLHLKAVQPMDRGDEWVWSGGPWHRVGPPIATR
jgi:TRAP-type C4-dicarboxylate transport system substrate-binding protein